MYPVYSKSSLIISHHIIPSSNPYSPLWDVLFGEVLALDPEESSEGVYLELEKPLFDVLGHCKRVDDFVFADVVELQLVDL